MKKNLVQKNVIHMILCLVTVLLSINILPVKTFADTGPKPSVAVQFHGLSEYHFYVTLISESKSTGPFTKEEHYRDSNTLGEQDIWEKLNQYNDTDGFYFLGQFAYCSGDSTYEWNYYPPSVFKILLYFPETDTFLVSEEITRSAFRSYYTVDVEDFVIQNISVEGYTKTGVKVRNTYDYFTELLELLERIVLTIATELLITLPFGFCKKNNIKVLLLMNVITQIGLNTLLNLYSYFIGKRIFAWYLIAEILVIAAENHVYQKNFEPKPDHPEKIQEIDVQGIKKIKQTICIYTILANIASFGIGLIIGG